MEKIHFGLRIWGEKKKYFVLEKNMDEGEILRLSNVPAPLINIYFHRVTVT